MQILLVHIHCHCWPNCAKLISLSRSHYLIAKRFEEQTKNLGKSGCNEKKLGSGQSVKEKSHSVEFEGKICWWVLSFRPVIITPMVVVAKWSIHWPWKKIVITKQMNECIADAVIMLNVRPNQCRVALDPVFPVFCCWITKLRALNFEQKCPEVDTLVLFPSANAPL